jgi:hypothetical protein
MMAWSRRLLPLVALAICAAPAATALGASSHGGPLTGTWSGSLSGRTHQHIVIVVNAKQNGGSWRVSATCYGPLTLDSISNGYHHYLRKRGRGSACPGGDVDCLKRAGPNVYDAVSTRLGGAYVSDGTLRRVR